MLTKVSLVEWLASAFAQLVRLRLAVLRRLIAMNMFNVFRVSFCAFCIVAGKRRGPSDRIEIDINSSRHEKHEMRQDMDIACRGCRDADCCFKGLVLRLVSVHTFWPIVMRSHRKRSQAETTDLQGRR